MKIDGPWPEQSAVLLGSKSETQNDTQALEELRYGVQNLGDCFK